MTCTRWWLHYIFVILYLHVNPIVSQNDEIVQCDFLQNNALTFYCRGSVKEESSYRDSYFCCQSYLHCRGGGTWQFKSNIRSIGFMPGCQFPRFNLSIFKSQYDGIQKLFLSNVNLGVVRLQDFTNAKKLLVFDASHNKLTEIPSMIFVNAPEITEVNFSFNEISLIDPSAFDNSSVDHPSKLRVLDLSNNQIDYIDNRTFAGLSALSTLILSSNLIQVVEADVFAQNKELSVLQLSYNKLTTFACQNFENLKYLNVEMNRLTKITLNGNYTGLEASSNQLKWITVESDLHSLETFNVSQNRIENIPEILHFFGETLKFLDVTDSYVGKLNVSTFMKMLNLKELVLRNTSLLNIPYGSFHHQKGLKLLDISFNNLKTIKFNVFSRDLRQLTTFLLDGNDLTEVNGLSTVNFPNLVRIGITKNNFTCDYLGGYVLQWINVHFVTDALFNRSQVEEIACNDGTEDHYVSGYDTHTVGFESVTTVIGPVVNEQPTNRIIDQPTTRTIECVACVDNGSTNRILLVLVLVILCIICVVTVTKNAILIQWSRQQQWDRDEAKM